jgi:hypothetical protein
MVGWLDGSVMVNRKNGNGIQRGANDESRFETQLICHRNLPARLELKNGLNGRKKVWDLFSIEK